MLTGKFKVAKRGRKKTGRTKFSYTISLTQEQIDWLDQYQGNPSELFRELLDDYTKSSENTSPETAKLGFKYRMLERQLRAAEAEEERECRRFIDDRGRYEDTVKHQELIRKLSQMPQDQIEITFDTDHNSVYLSDGISNVSFRHYGGEEDQFALAYLKEELQKVESVEFQKKIEQQRLQRDISEKIWLSKKLTVDNIEKKKQEIEKALLSG